MASLKRSDVPALVLLAVILAVVVPANAQTYSVLWNFGTRAADPANPYLTNNLTRGVDGFLYGTSVSGGKYGSGAIFLSDSPGHLQVLYSFCALANCADGSFPTGLTLDHDGNFYGTTSEGGANGSGTIFKMARGGAVTTLYSFSNSGPAPEAPPIVGPWGILYGTLSGGSACGGVYSITPAGVYTDLHDFDHTDGCGPLGALVLGTDGNFYGTTRFGGTLNDGVAFKITPNGKFTLLYNFGTTSGSEIPLYALVEGSDGNFYGTTGFGAHGSGDIFQLTPSGTLTVLYSFLGTTDGRNPTGLVLGSDGNFYGAAASGGSNICGSPNDQGGCGTLFQITPSGTFSVIYNFNSTNGSQSLITPFQDTNGLLYGDTNFGGSGTACRGSRGKDLCGVLYSFDEGLPAFVSLSPFMGKVGSYVEIFGQGFDSSTTVSFNGIPSTTGGAGTSTYMRALVPTGATSGFVTVTTSSGTLTSNRQFIVTP